MSMQLQLEGGNTPLNIQTHLEDSPRFVEQKTLKTFAKISEDLFLDPNSSDVKKRLQSLSQLRNINTKFWNNIPPQICDAIALLQNSSQHETEFFNKQNNTLREMLHLLTYNIEVIADRIDTRVEIMAQRQLLAFQGAQALTEQAVVRSGEYCREYVAEQAIQISEAAEQRALELVEAKIKTSFEVFTADLEKRISGVASRLRTEISEGLKQYETDNCQVEGVIGPDCKYENLGVYLKASIKERAALDEAVAGQIEEIEQLCLKFSIALKA